MSTVLAKLKVMKLRALINLLSSFIAHNRRNNKDKDLLTSRSCLIFQWFHQRNAVLGLAENRYFREDVPKKTAVLLDFVQMRGGEGPSQIVVTFS